MFSNFAQHVGRNHKDETEVQKIIKEKDERKGKNLIVQLRRRSDHEHNRRVELAEKGQIIIGRRFSKGKFSVKEYGPSPKCLEWLKKDGFQGHMKQCPARGSMKESQCNLVIQSDILTGHINSLANKA